jgi:hypothetical protein
MSSTLTTRGPSTHAAKMTLQRRLRAGSTLRKILVTRLKTSSTVPSATPLKRPLAFDLKHLSSQAISKRTAGLPNRANSSGMGAYAMGSSAQIPNEAAGNHLEGSPIANAPMHRYAACSQAGTMHASRHVLTLVKRAGSHARRHRTSGPLVSRPDSTRIAFRY